MAKKEKGKQQKEPKKGGNPTIHKLYKVEGETLKRERKTCPKCGSGYFMAKHKDRSTCGKCGYCEFSKKE